jgi:superoxide reductase
MRTETVGLFHGVNRPDAPENLTDLEKMHLPVITAPEEVRPGDCFDVTVEVGVLLAHPNDRRHFVQHIDLLAGDVFLVRLSLTGQTSLPRMTACLRLEKDLGPLRAVALCNVHGAWEAERPIRVR